MPEGPFGGPRPFISARQRCEPEIRFRIESVIDVNNLMNSIENKMREMSLQIEDIVIGHNEGDTTVQIIFLRQEIQYNKLGDLVDYIKREYNAVDIRVTASREVR